MKATEAQVLSFLKQSPQFVIPIYQRSYSWLEQDCRQLWTDILRAGRDHSISSHFIGSVVYVEKGLYSVSGHSPMLVIDGQQRLTTVTLLIEALARAVGEDEPVEGFSARKLRNYYLLNPEEDGERLCQVVGAGTKRGELWPVSGWGQLIGEVIPKGESIVSGVSVTSGGEAVTVRTKEGVDLVMGGTKALGVMRRLEPLHHPFSPPRRFV